MTDDIIWENDGAICFRLTPRVEAALYERRIGIRPAGQRSYDHIVFPRNIVVEAYSSFPSSPILYQCGAFSSTETTADLALAVHEVATNSLVHGSGSGDLQIWREAGALVCVPG